MTEPTAMPNDPALPKHQMHCFWISAGGETGAVGDTQARFPYWSFTKTVLAICAFKLAKAGLLDLDAPFAGQQYNLRQVLAHTAGLPDYRQLPEYHQAVARGDRPWSREELLQLTLARGMLFAPGTAWSYSNIGYMFVREAIEQAAGRPFAALVVDLICNPLNLRSVELLQSVAQSATLHWPAAAHFDPAWVYHGCLAGNAGDAARLLHALFCGDLLDSDSLSQMRLPRRLGGAIANRPWLDHGYALGLMAGEMAVGRAIGHSGSGPFCANALYHFPDLATPLTVACFTDGSDEALAENAALRVAEAFTGGRRNLLAQS